MLIRRRSGATLDRVTVKVNATEGSSAAPTSGSFYFDKTSGWFGFVESTVPANTTAAGIYPLPGAAGSGQEETLTKGPGGALPAPYVVLSILGEFEVPVVSSAKLGWQYLYEPAAKTFLAQAPKSTAESKWEGKASYILVGKVTAVGTETAYIAGAGPGSTTQQKSTGTKSGSLPEEGKMWILMTPVWT